MMRPKLETGGPIFKGSPERVKGAAAPLPVPIALNNAFQKSTSYWKAKLPALRSLIFVFSMMSVSPVSKVM
jgi:hypothetical protein